MVTLNFGRFGKVHIDWKGKNPSTQEVNRYVEENDIFGKLQAKQKPVENQDTIDAAKDVTPVRDLLDYIGKYEANGGDYNAYYNYFKKEKIDFSQMTLDEVLDWQDQYVRSGSASSAVGKYQIIRSTLRDLKRKLNLKGDEKFTPDLQDQLGETLLKSRGYDDYLSGSLSPEDFALNLSKEWAALPVVRDTQRWDRKSGKYIPIPKGNSYYSGVAGNATKVDAGEFLSLVTRIKPAEVSDA